MPFELHRCFGEKLLEIRVGHTLQRETIRDTYQHDVPVASCRRGRCNRVSRDKPSETKHTIDADTIERFFYMGAALEPYTIAPDMSFAAVRADTGSDERHEPKNIQSYSVTTWDANNPPRMTMPGYPPRRSGARPDPRLWRHQLQTLEGGEGRCRLLRVAAAAAAAADDDADARGAARTAAAAAAAAEGYPPRRSGARPNPGRWGHQLQTIAGGEGERRLLRAATAATAAAADVAVAAPTGGPLPVTFAGDDAAATAVALC